MAEDDRVDRLYGLAPGAFVGERDALAKALRGEGRRDAASTVKALSRPTVAAWAVNQAVRSQPRQARELWSAGDALADAQAAVVAGRARAPDLRAAAEAERRAVGALVEAARGLLDDRGRDLSETTLERVRSTLHAAAVDPGAREAVAAGRAERELEPPGLGGFGGALGAVAPGRTKAARAPDARPERAATSKGDAAAEGKGARARAAAERKAAAERRERDRERRSARRRVEQAEAALERARREAAAAAERLEAARGREEEASTALDDARAALDALE